MMWNKKKLKSAGLLPGGRLASPRTEDTQVAAQPVALRSGEVRGHPSGWVLSG